jgi:glucose-6-phosphate isomerase, archaeal
MKTYKKTIRKFETEGKKGTRTLKDMPNYYEKGALSKLNPKTKIYDLFTKDFSPIKMTLTEMYPGSVGKEYFYTKGHIHTKQTPEFYILLEGFGKLLIQKNNKPTIIKMKLGEITLIPKGYAHRLINTSNKKMKVLTIYHEDSKPSYKVKFKKKVFKK